MKSINKSIGLSETEFRLLLSLYSIDNVMSFEMSGEDNPSALDTFSLYKKGYIENSAESMTVSAEISEIFSAISKSKSCVTFESEDKELSSLFLLFSDYRYVVWMEPGSRQGEYVKIRSVMLDDLLSELEDIGMIRQSDIEDVVVPDKDDDAPVSATVATIKILDSRTGKVRSTISIVLKGVGERICVDDGTEINYYPYSGKKIISEIMEVVNQNDIS